MKALAALIIIGMVLLAAGCEKENISQNAAALSVQFSWKDMKPCGWGNPEIHVGGIPAETKFLEISMYDHVYRHDHGTVVVPYTGNETIARGQHKKIQGPCPPGTRGRYEITIKAIDEKEAIIGIGRMERFFPEKDQS